MDVRKRAGRGKATIPGKTDLFELEELSFQSFILLYIILGWLLLDIYRLVRRGRELLGVELRGGHHDVSVGRWAHGRVTGRGCPNAHGRWRAWDRRGGRGRKGQPRGRRTDDGRRSVKWVESGNGDFRLSLCDRARAFYR